MPAARPARFAAALRRLPVPAACLLAGLLAGVGGTWLLAPQPAAAALDVCPNDKFVLFTVRNNGGGIGIGGSDSIFVLDAVNGKLYGGTLGGNGQFVASFGRDIAQDFGARQANAQYAVVSGSNAGGQGIVYVAENRSGVVAAYAIPNGTGRRAALVPVATFQFREAIQ